ncbi:MAG: hypothetical protein AAF492_26410, partial [Verrucomicrobiota bacterium]
MTIDTINSFNNYELVIQGGNIVFLGELDHAGNDVTLLSSGTITDSDSNIDVTANRLTVSANNGISDSGGGNPFETDVSALDVVVNNTGLINIDEADMLDVIQAVNANGDIILSAGGHIDLQGNVEALGALVRLSTTGGGNITQSGGRAAGNELAINAAGGVNLGSSNNDFDTAAGDASGGALILRDLDDLRIDAVGVETDLTSGPGQAIILRAGSLILDAQINPGTDLTLIATNGGIDQTDGRINAANLAFDAAGDVNLTRPNNNFTAQIAGVSSGTISVVDDNGLTVGSFGGYTGLTAPMDIDLQADLGNLSLGAAVDAGSANVRLSALGGNIDQPGGAITAGGVEFEGNTVRLDHMANAFDQLAGASMG